MRKKNTIRTRLLAALLTVLLLAGLAILPAAAGDDCVYEYQLLPQAYSKGDLYKLDLYVVVHRPNVAEEAAATEPAGQLLTAGSFGLSFPETMDVSFDFAGRDLQLKTIVPKDRLKPEERSETDRTQKVLDRDTYYAFSWMCSVDKPLDEQWRQSFTTYTGWGLKLGTFTLDLDPTKEDTATVFDLPGGDKVKQLDWLTIPEAVVAEKPEVSKESDPVNKAIWNAETRCYQGFYEDPDPSTLGTAIPIQTDIGFVSGLSDQATLFTLRSYDPKKPAVVRLLDESDRPVSGLTFEVPVWQDRDAADKVWHAADYNAGDGQGTGTGIYHANVTVKGSTELEKDKTYTLVVEKPGSLTLRLALTGPAGGSLKEALAPYTNPDETWPDGCLYLPAGDLNPRTAVSGETSVTTVGDGRIDFADRAALEGCFGVRPTAPGSAALMEHTASSQDELAYYADLDGDGRVTTLDLSILLSPENLTEKEGT